VSVLNATPYAVLAAPYVAPDGREIVVTVVKATFVMGAGGKLALADEQVPVRPGDDVYDPDALASSIRYPSDFGTDKRGVDVVVVGDAISRTPVPTVDVAVQMKRRTVPLRVHGTRMFYRSFGNVAIGPPAAFERKPIVYEHAYGGMTADFSMVERKNPVGKGVAKSVRDLVDTPAPTIEHPGQPVTAAGQRVEPVGFGAIATWWLPRAAHAGTFDETWQRTRMPLMPPDFDPRFFNVAHPALQFDEPLAADEPIHVLGMSESGSFHAELPAIGVVLRGKIDSGVGLSARPAIDLALVEPGPGRIELSLRHAFPKGRGRTLLREITIDTET
jgi:hypothetical protein